MEEQDIMELMKKGTQHQLSGELNEAENIYRQVLTAQEGPVVHNNLGFLLLQKKNYAEAIEEFSKAIDLKADYAAAYKHLGYAYLLSGETELAIEATKECFELDPSDAEVVEILANYHFISQNWPLAAYYRRKAYELSGKTGHLTELAYALLMDSRIEEATDLLESILANAASRSSRVYSLLGTAYTMTHNLGLAISNYRQALGLEPENIEARNNMALCLLQTGNAAEAMTEFKRVIMLQPDHSEARNNLAVLEIAAGNTDAALKNFDAVLGQQPDNAKALYYKSGLLFQKRKFDEAKVLLEKLIATPDQSYRSKATEILSNLQQQKH